MDILSIIGMLDKADSLRNIAQEVGQPVGQAMDSARMGLADFFGDTKMVADEGYDSVSKEIDQKAFNDRMSNIAKASAGLAQMPETKPGVLSPQVISSPAPMGQAPNPYQPVDYGTIPYGQPMQYGIGSEPSMEQILKALQSRGQ